MLYTCIDIFKSIIFLISFFNSIYALYFNPEYFPIVTILFYTVYFVYIK